MRNPRKVSERFNPVTSVARSAEAIFATASLVSSARAELDNFRDLLAAGRRHIDGSKSCIEQSIEALNLAKTDDVPAAGQPRVGERTTAGRRKKTTLSSAWRLDNAQNTPH